MYFDRPADELIFLTSREHHEYRKGKPAWNNGKKMSEEFCRKDSESNKGEKNPFYGRHHTEESKRRNSEAHKGNTNTKGRHWFNNGKENKYCYECPPGFAPGVLRK